MFKHLLESLQIYLLFLVGNFHVARISISGLRKPVPLVLPRKLWIMISFYLITLTYNAWSWNWSNVGLSLQPPLRRCSSKCSSRGSCENFSDKMKIVSSEYSLSNFFANATNDFTKMNNHGWYKTSDNG